MSEAAVSTLFAQSLRKKYKTRTVVEDVSFEVKSGEVVGLLGPNGAGKTTCFYMIVGLVPADGGEVYIDDSRLTHLPMHKRARQGLSYLPQEASIFRKLSVEENIRAVLELLKTSRRRTQRSTRRPARRTAHRPCSPHQCGGTFGRRAAPGRNRPRAGDQPALHPARRTFCRGRSDRRARHPEDHPLPQGTRHRRADYRPQRPRNPRHLRSRLHHQRRECAGGWLSSRNRRERKRAQGLSWRAFQALISESHSSPSK